jgi:hypothetical protein
MRNRRSRIVGRASWVLFMVLLAVPLWRGTLALRAQAPDTAALRAQLEERYNVVPLQNGIALTPKKSADTVRLIEIRDGVVSINGDPVSARDLKQRLGSGADLVLRVTYLDAAALKGLAAPAGAPTISPERRDDDNERDERRREGDGAANRTRRGDVVRFGGNVSIGRDEYVDGDVAAIGGSVNVDGEVRGEVTAVGGSATFGPDSHVRGDVTIVGGTLNRAAGSRIDGQVNEVSGMGPFGGGHGPWNIRTAPWWGTFWRFGSLVGTLLRVTLLAMGVMLVTALGTRYVETVGTRTIADPLRSGLTGLVAEVLFIPLLVLTCIVLAISIVGIPLLVLVPFAVVLALAMMLVGFTGVAHEVGRWLLQRFNASGGTYVRVLVGLLAVVGLTIVAKIVGVLGGFAGVGIVGSLIGFVGLMVEYAAWTIGAGAVILTWYQTRRRGPRVAQAAGEVPVSEEGLR